MSVDYRAQDQKDLRQFYTRLASKPRWCHLLPLLSALDSLLGLRDEKRLFVFTSHEILVFTPHAEYPAWARDDVVAIAPLRSGEAEVEGMLQRLKAT